MPVSRKLCEGCDTYENNVCLVNPSTIRKGIKRMCPCTTCLIKGMCTRECREYGEYEAFIKGMGKQRNSILKNIPNKANINQLFI
jgi:hypothetical protein